MTNTPRARIPMFRDADRVLACQRGLSLARQLGFNAVDRAAVETIILELSQNILDHAGKGLLTLRLRGRGVEVASFDHGPGIADIDEALRDGYSTRGTLGSGLPCVRRLSDAFRIRSMRGVGTVVTATRCAHEAA